MIRIFFFIFLFTFTLLAEDFLDFANKNSSLKKEQNTSIEDSSKSVKIPTH